MGRLSIRRIVRVSAVAALVVGGLALPADANSDRVAASTGRIDDPSGTRWAVG